MSTVAPVVLLLAVLGFAVVRPRGLPEAVVAVPAAGLVVASGLVPWSAAVHELRVFGPTIGFLAAILVLADLADQHGVFRYAGTLAGRLSGGSPRRLLAVIFVVASAITAALSLDATVVLLTPVVFATAATVGTRPRPHVYACTHLANSASLLLPVSNLTNLLAFAATGIGFLKFAGLMAAPWLFVIAAEYLVFRRFFAVDLDGPVEAVVAEPVPAPVFALVVLGATLAGFGLAQQIGIHPAWIALAGAAVLAVPLLTAPTPVGQRWSASRHAVGRLLRAANPAFLAFVAGLAVVVLAVRRGGLGHVVAALAPSRADLVGLLLIAVLAAVLANVLNNLPATLVLVPLVSHSPALVLATLIGVNVGPNLSYAGSLATLLWRRILHDHTHPPAGRDFLRLGALTVPLCLVLAVIALWTALRIAHLG